MGGCTASTVDQQNSEARIRHNSVLLEENISCAEVQNFHRSSFVQQGIKIRKNSVTGMLEGMPEEWCQKFNFPFRIDQSKTVCTRNLPQ